MPTPPLTRIELSSSAPTVQSLISFLEHEVQPMIVLDPDYTILAANVAYQRQFGSIGQPVSGHKCYRISHHYDAPCDQAGEHCLMKKARVSPSTWPDGRGLAALPGCQHGSAAGRMAARCCLSCRPKSLFSLHSSLCVTLA